MILIQKELFVLDSSTWNHLTVCKQRILNQKELLVLDSSTWNYLTLCKHMILNQKELLVLDSNTWNHSTVVLVGFVWFQCLIAYQHLWVI